jgi:hypothetical protein
VSINLEVLGMILRQVRQCESMCQSEDFDRKNDKEDRANGDKQK